MCFNGTNRAKTYCPPDTEQEAFPLRAKTRCSFVAARSAFTRPGGTPCIFSLCSKVLDRVNQGLLEEKGSYSSEQRPQEGSERPISVHAPLSLRINSRHWKAWICWSLHETSARNRRSLKAWSVKGTGGLSTPLWISSGSPRRFMTWVTRARESPSRAAILALVSWISFCISWRHDWARTRGCVRWILSSHLAVEARNSTPKGRGGKGIGEITKGCAPQREKGMPMVRLRSQQVRVLAPPAEPFSRTRSTSFAYRLIRSQVRCVFAGLW